MRTRRRAHLFSTTARIAALSAVVCLVLSAVLSIQMAAGNDPVLGPKERGLASHRRDGPRHRADGRRRASVPAVTNVPQAPPPPPPPVVTQTS
jgi:hypothetical protein